MSRRRFALGLALRLAVALIVALGHRALGGWLAGLDPLDELISGRRFAVGVAIALFVPLRIATWFVVAPALGAYALRGIVGLVREGREQVTRGAEGVP